MEKKYKNKSLKTTQKTLANCKTKGNKKVAKLRDALKRIELLEITGELRLGVVSSYQIPVGWAARFYLKIAKHVKDRRKVFSK